MLLQNKSPTAAGEIVAIKISTGEEIVGRLVDTGDKPGVTISKPIIVQLQMVRPGEAAIGFQPFMLSRDDDGEYTFSDAAIVVGPSKARDDIRTNYLKATTGLEIPTGSSLIK